MLNFSEFTLLDRLSTGALK